METITSGTTTERMVRAILLALLVDAFGCAYLWDGHAGYARENGTELARLLGVDPGAVSDANQELTRGLGMTIAEETKSSADLASATAALGEPTIVHGTDAYYLGPGGWLHVARDGKRVVSATWSDGKRTESDQLWQRWIGYTLAVLGIIATANLVRVLKTRATLSDEGLLIGGHRISWDAITNLRADLSDKDGRVELAFTDQGKPKVLHLNAYVYKALPAIVEAIRDRKQFGQDAPRES